MKYHFHFGGQLYWSGQLRMESKRILLSRVPATTLKHYKMTLVKLKKQDCGQKKKRTSRKIETHIKAKLKIFFTDIK